MPDKFRTPLQWMQSFLAALLFVYVLPAQADSITMKDGSTRTGTIVGERNGTVQFRDPTYGEMYIPRAQIADMSRESDQAATGNVNTFLATANAEKQRGNLGAAIANLVQAAKVSLTTQVVNEFHTTFQQLSQQAASQIATTPDQARENYKALYAALADPISQQLFTLGTNHPTFQQAATEIATKYAEANVMLARRMENNTAMRAQVQNLYSEAVALTQSQNPSYLISLGDAARNNGDLDTAFNSYKAVIDSGNASQDQLDTAYERLSRIATASGGRLRMPTATPAITVTPEFTVATPVAAAPVYQIPVATAPEAPPLPLWKHTWNSIKDGSIFKKAWDFIDDFVGEDLLIIAGVIAALFVMLWMIPYQILKFLAKRGDNLAGERLYNAKKLGFIALTSYMVSRFSQVRATRHRCPFCNKSIDNMEEYKDLNFVVCPHCREPITPIYDMKDYIDHLIGQLKISQKASRKGKRGDVLIERDAMLKLVRGVLSLAIRRRASDFHLETANEGGKIRARIDGIMYDLQSIPREISPAFISALKVMANLDITERRVPQDGKIPLWIDQQDFDLRINTSPASMGEKVVIRILRQDAINITPDRLGLDGTNLSIYERNIHKPHGVIIVTGPSGSGKSTTLYVALNELNSGDKNIVTIEDPIEYQLKGLSQMQVNPGANFTFATGLRSILRQDPDVIMVGEIRDKETAEAALDAAMTGHMVLTTLHTIDAPSAFSRMRDLGIEQARVANAVNLIIAQRLVRTICSDCRKIYNPKSADLEKLGLQKDGEIQFVHGTGCDTCMNTGYYGRLAVFEMLELTDDIRSKLETNAATTAVREAARANGMRSLREEGVRKIQEGVTTVEEVIRVTT